MNRENMPSQNALKTNSGNFPYFQCKIILSSGPNLASGPILTYLVKILRHDLTIEYSLTWLQTHSFSPIKALKTTTHKPFRQTKKYARKLNKMKTSPENAMPKKMKALKKDISFVKKGVVELESQLVDCLWANETTLRSLLREKRKELQS